VIAVSSFLLIVFILPLYRVILILYNIRNKYVDKDNNIFINFIYNKADTFNTE